MSGLAQRVALAIDKCPAIDLHTHLFAPEFSGLTSSGIDDLLTYHYLIAEVLRFRPDISAWHLLSLKLPERADLIWETLFVNNTPISEATCGVVKVLTALGLDPCAPTLDEARRYFASRNPAQHLDDVFRLANISSLVMTNDPLNPEERAIWESGVVPDPRFHAALRIDPILNHWPSALPGLSQDGYHVHIEPEEDTIDEVRRFLDVWIERMNPRYVAISLPDTFAYPEASFRVLLLDGAVLPACRDHGLPLAIMIGVRRKVNPSLGDAGDGMGIADLSAISSLASENSGNKFMVSTLAKENVHSLCVLARKFSNLLPFGCWWFMNNPSLVEETTLLRLEMLGTSFVPQHSDARILEQLLYKWPHARECIAKALTTRYLAVEEAGRPISDADIERDAKALLYGVAADWLRITT